VVDQLTDLFHTTHKVRTQLVSKSRGHHDGNIEVGVIIVGTLLKSGVIIVVTLNWFPTLEGPVSLVLDLRIVHDRFGRSSETDLKGHLHYPNDIDRSLNESATDKIRKYRSYYNNNSPNVYHCDLVLGVVHPSKDTGGPRSSSPGP
jgi:hypothetical protein